MALTEKDVSQLKLIIEAAMGSFSGDIIALDQKIDGLKELFIEKLNGHVGEVERLVKDVDELGKLQRKTESDLGALRERVVEVEGSVKIHAAVSKARETGKEKTDQAVQAVKSGITAAHLAWVGAGAGLLGALGAVLLQWILSGGK